MKFKLNDGKTREWQVNKIGVIGPGIVGMPMAAMLADAEIRIGSPQPAQVIVIQRDSPTSGWKVEAINAGKSVIGGVEPKLAEIVRRTAAKGLLQASSDYNMLTDADVVLVAIQTDKIGFEPDYGPLMQGLTALAEALRQKPPEKTPLIIFESTLAPSSMATVITDHFSSFGLHEGRDILLGNSPNRVMPGRLVERVAQSDKLVAGLRPETPKLIEHLYRHIVSDGTLFRTNSMTAETVKTLENAYRDVRIAFTAELARFCDANDIDFYALRDQVNSLLNQQDDASGNATCVPSGGLLVPTVGVGGHCLPKDGILLWWRRILAGHDTEKSVIVKARTINDASPAATVSLLENRFSPGKGSRIGVLGTAYRFNSEDTRNSPSIQLALQLQQRGYEVILHDPYVKPGDQNLRKFKVDNIFTNDLPTAVAQSEYIIFATAHHDYQQDLPLLIDTGKKLRGVIDGCNLFNQEMFAGTEVDYTGIGRGHRAPEPDLLDFVYRSFKNMERVLAREVMDTCIYLNTTYAAEDPFNRIDFSEVQRLAGSCSTGCKIADVEQTEEIGPYGNFRFELTDNSVTQEIV